VLWDVRPHGLTGSKIEYLCDLCDITINKNTVHGDKNALAPGGVRVGTAALTTRGFKEPEFVKVAEFLLKALAIVLAVQAESGKKLEEFKAKAVPSRADIQVCFMIIVIFCSVV
jgi:glycine hydroxymethyltransferase